MDHNCCSRWTTTTRCHFLSTIILARVFIKHLVSLTKTDLHQHIKLRFSLLLWERERRERDGEEITCCTWMMDKNVISWKKFLPQINTNYQASVPNIWTSEGDKYQRTGMLRGHTFIRSITFTVMKKDNIHVSKLQTCANTKWAEITTWQTRKYQQQLSLSNTSQQQSIW
jgi:hypothetical protein